MRIAPGLARRVASGSALLWVLAPTVARAADTKTCVGLSEEGQRQRAEKKLVAAKDLFTSCSQQACPKLVRDDCSAWLREVDADLPSVIFVVQTRSGKLLDTASVLVDGSSSRIADGTATPLDPGGHSLRVTAGAAVQDSTIVVMVGEKGRRVVLSVDDASVATPAANARSSAPSPPSALPLYPFVVIGAGVVVAGVGAVFEGVALSEDSKSNRYAAAADQELTANPQCGQLAPDPTTCPNNYSKNSHHNSATSDQNIALPMIAVGGLGMIAGGVLLYIAWPSAPRSSFFTVTPSIGAGHAALGLSGSF